MQVLNGATYELFDKNLTWTDAARFCESRNGHLVTITSEQEQSLIETMLEKGSMHQYWIGLSSVSGQFQWITDEEYAYSHWDAGEPNGGTKAGGETEQYAQIYNVSNPVLGNSQRFFWNDIFIAIQIMIRISNNQLYGTIPDNLPG